MTITSDPTPPRKPFLTAPKAKVTAGALAGAVSMILITELNNRLGAGIDATEGASITVVLSFLASYLMPDSD